MSAADGVSATDVCSTDVSAGMAAAGMAAAGVPAAVSAMLCPGGDGRKHRERNQRTQGNEGSFHSLGSYTLGRSVHAKLLGTTDPHDGNVSATLAVSDQPGWHGIECVPCL